MRERFNRFFNLTMNPFGETPDPRFFFESDTHLSALEGLLQAIRAGKGISTLIGEVGTGKTLLTRMFLKALGNSADTALVLYPHCDENELLRTIHEEFEIEPAPRLLDSLNAMLLREDRRDRQTVLVIDEAQNLPLETLETIRLLGNLETEQRKLLNIVLVAQPELESRLAQDNLRQLRQRIGVSARLQPLNDAETAAYIKHRLDVAGGANLVRFDADAIAWIHKLSQGVPREINRICERMLSVSLQKRNRLIRKAEVREVFAQQEGSRTAWLPKLWTRREVKIP